jgi:nucleoside-diphosphate-sugar epimerase
VTQRKRWRQVVDRYHIDTIYHMAAILSAVGEEKPLLAWDVNINGLYNVLEAAREHNLPASFAPAPSPSLAPRRPATTRPRRPCCGRRRCTV